MDCAVKKHNYLFMSKVAFEMLIKELSGPLRYSEGHLMLVFHKFGLQSRLRVCFLYINLSVCGLISRQV